MDYINYEVLTPPRLRLTSETLDNLCHPVLLNGSNGQRFSGLHLNRGENSEPPLIRFNAMFEASNSPGQKYAAALYATAFPDREILVIDMPAHGHSSGLTAAQHEEIKKYGTMRSVATSQLTAIKQQLPRIEAAVVEGESSGALLAANFAAQALHNEIETRQLFGFDMAGLEQRRTIAMTADYYRSVIFGRWAYELGRRNSGLRSAFNDVFRPELERACDTANDWRMINVFGTGSGILKYVWRGSPLATDKGFEVLEEALHFNPRLEARMVVAGHSAIARWRHIGGRALRLADDYPDRLHWHLWPNDNHNMGLAHQMPRPVKFVKYYTELDQS